MRSPEHTTSPNFEPLANVMDQFMKIEGKSHENAGLALRAKAGILKCVEALSLQHYSSAEILAFLNENYPDFRDKLVAPPDWSEAGYFSLQSLEVFDYQEENCAELEAYLAGQILDLVLPDRSATGIHQNKHVKALNRVVDGEYGFSPEERVNDHHERNRDTLVILDGVLDELTKALKAPGFAVDDFAKYLFARHINFFTRFASQDMTCVDNPADSLTHDGQAYLLSFLKSPTSWDGEVRRNLASDYDKSIYRQQHYLDHGKWPVEKTVKVKPAPAHKRAPVEPVDLDEFRPGGLPSLIARFRKMLIG